MLPKHKALYRHVEALDTELFFQISHRNELSVSTTISCSVIVTTGLAFLSKADHGPDIAVHGMIANNHTYATR